jgi:excisionase family DNA binding protein
MKDSTYRAPEGYLTLAEARTRLGVAKATITRMVQDGRLPTFDHPRDRRVSLVKIEDVERLAQPRPRTAQEAPESSKAA